MKNSIIFSVVIPVYNKEPHIARSINSVLEQTFKNFELIIVCDPSTDNSNIEVEKFTDSRIRIFYRDKSGPGGYAGRNLGIKESKGKWIAFLDADDEWLPKHLENYYEIITQNKEVKFLCSAYKIKDEKGIVINDAFFNSLLEKENQKIDTLKYLQLTTEGYRPAWTSVVCIKNTINARSIFPDGRAKRGGDQFAWVYYISKEKNMIWSTKIGAIYHKDSVNMVTKTSPSNPSILAYEYDTVKQYLSVDEIKYLQKYINRRLVTSYFRNKLEKNMEICKLYSCVFFQNDKFFYVKNVLLSLVPIAFYKYLQKIKRFIFDS